MTITTNSPLQDTINIYLNTSYDTQLFFQDNKAEFSYIVTQRDGDVYRVVGYGMLKGRGNNQAEEIYDYRFDFKNYIKIPKWDGVIINDSTYLSTFNNNNKTDLYLSIMSDNDILTDNVANGNIIQLTNGEYILDGTTPVGLDGSYYFEYNFIDRNESASLYVPSVINKGTVVPLTIYVGTMYFNMYDINNTPIVISENFTHDSDYDYTVGLITIPTNCHKILFELRIESTQIWTGTVFTGNVCSNDYYFFSTKGNFELLSCQGNYNDLVSTEKEEIKIGNKVVYTKYNITKQIKQNSGLLLSDALVRDFVQSTFVYKINETTVKEYTIDNTGFEGYTGVSLGNKNIEFVFTDPVRYERSTNKTLTFFD
jgi:hypothetical protein